jgi:hypothetical protein
MQPIALVPRNMTIAPDELALVASAVQIQLLRDFGPAWNIQASLTAFATLAAVPQGSLIVFLVADANGRAGLHFRPQSGQPPFALVTYRADGLWSVALSHEVIELLVDPVGNRMFEGPDPQDPTSRVQFLAEPCDPCQDVTFSYQIDPSHHVYVSDFCLPAFYGLGTGSAPFTHRRSILTPYSVASGGYLSWRSDSNEWFQLSAMSGAAQFIHVSESDVLSDRTKNLNYRGTLDRKSSNYSGPLTGKATRSFSGQARRLGRQSDAGSKRQRDRALEKHLKSLGV